MLMILIMRLAAIIIIIIKTYILLVSTHSPLAVPYSLYPIELLPCRLTDGGGRLGSGHPQKTLQSPDRLYKAPGTLFKHINIRQNPKLLDTYRKYLTRVATTFNLAYNSQYLISKPHISF